MPNWIAKLQPNPWLLRKLLMLAVLIGVGVAAFVWGRSQHVVANPADNPDSPGSLSQIPSDYHKRVVAYLYNKQVPVTRAELGEYLISRFGGERIEFMLNRKIVEMECQKYNIIATNAEVEDRFQQDLKSFGTHLTQTEFVNSVLKRFGKSLYEWKEDVIRPKIMMEKLVKQSVKITDKDVQEGYDARYGPKVDCRMIVCDPKANILHVQKTWEEARKGGAFFLAEARKQFIPNLASAEGKIPAIHKHFGDKDIEETAFRLKEGEVSALLKMQDGSYVILLCEKHVPAIIAVRFEDVRLELSREVFNVRVAQKIPEAFAEMHKRAAPYVVLDNTGQASSAVPSGLTSAAPPIELKPAVKVEMPPAPVPQTVTLTPLPDAPIPTPNVAIPPPTVTPMPTLTPPAKN